MFTWNKKWMLRPVKVGNTTIGLSNSAKFLGVTLDNKLNYNEHISNITKKATSSLMQCKKAVGPTWGLNPKTCKWIYTAVIRPILSYCACVWIRATNTKTNVTKLERVQALALRIMSGAMPSTPFNALNYITNTSNIIAYLKGEAAKGACRLQGYGDWSLESPPKIKGTIHAHTTINNEFIADLNIPKCFDRDLTTPVLNLDRNFIVMTPGENTEDYRRNLHNLIENTHPNTITCYTDGSRTEAGCGSGYIITTNNNDTKLKETYFKLPDHCSVFQAELSAIRDACNNLTAEENKHIIIWTDSLSAIQALTTCTIRSRTVIDCYTAISRIANNNKVELRWIAAHRGLWGNEKADELAKLGTTSEDIRSTPIPQSYIKNKINNKVKLLSNNAWIANKHSHTNMTIGGRNTEAIIKQINANLSNSRNNYRTALHLITGHCGLNKHLHRINRSTTNLCPACETEEETVSHFLGNCPATAELRNNIFTDYYLDVNYMYNKYNITTIINYINLTNRFNKPEDSDQTGVS